MNTERRSHVLFAMLLFLSVTAYSQHRYAVGLLPAINLNKGLGAGWSVNAKWESRQLLGAGAFDSAPEFASDYLLSDASLLLSKKVGIGHSFAGGLLLRLRSGGEASALRTIQQFTITRALQRIRTAHRFVTDQTFGREDPLQLRLRYRLTAEVPLRGESVDPGELYVKANLENLHVLTDGRYDLEFRLVPLLGFVVSDNSKFEIGPDYRIRSFLRDTAESQGWGTLSWYVRI